MPTSRSRPRRTRWRWRAVAVSGLHRNASTRSSAWSTPRIFSPRSGRSRAQHGADHHAAAALRARHARGRGRPVGHEAAQDPPRGRARRIWRHGRAGDHGGPPRGDRRPHLRRVRSARQDRRAATAPRVSTARCRSRSSTPSSTRPSTIPTTPRSADTSSDSSAACPAPATGSTVGSHVLEVVEMDGRRVKTLRLHAPQPAPGAPAAGAETPRV